MKRLFTSVLAVLACMAATPVFAASGGPDTYGYTWKDSDEPGGPAFNWIEIATPAGGTGTYRTVLNCDDCHEAGVPIGFNFPYYGAPMSALSMSSNGTIYFENVYLGLSNACMPGTPGYTMTQYRFIAHMWDDLAPNYQGGVYTQAFPNYFVVEYYDIVPCCSAGDGDTWEVILFRNGNILMQYKELSNQGLQTDYTVGIQNDPSTGLQYNCNNAGIPLASNRAILFSPPTFSCSSVAQNILGNNTGFCTGSSVNLNAGAASIAQLWSTTATTSTINVNTVGNYSIIALDTNGCTVHDTISVAENPLPVVNLGPDATACGAQLLDAGNAGMTYQWSDNSTAQTLNATTSGTYSVVVTNPLTTCANNDAITLTVNPLPAVTLGADITQCGGVVMLDAGNAGMDFMWSDNSTSQTIATSTSGTYIVTVTNPSTSCANSDTILVTINPVPVVALGADITQCGGNVMLDAGNAGFDYLWNDGSTTQTLTASTSGSYSVTVTDPATGCSGNDQVDVTINALPVVTLGGDVTQCGSSVVLDAGNAGFNYLWNDGTTTQMLTATTSGSYSVTVTDPATNCSANDMINVTLNAVPVVALGADVTQCGGSVTLDAGNQGMNYLWNDGTTTQTLNVTLTGQYMVDVTDPATGCTGSDTIGVAINALPTVNFTLGTTMVCVDDAGFTLTGGTPSGGVYSGPGTSAGMFNPSSGIGAHVITYTYTDSNTGCANTATQTITVNACTGIDEQNVHNIHLFPNPSSGIVNIETPANGLTVEVFNTIGERVIFQEVNAGSTKLDLSSNPDGAYFIRVSTANGSLVEKIILQR